jgi:hypothetical protein
MTRPAALSPEAFRRRAAQLLEEAARTDVGLAVAAGIGYVGEQLRLERAVDDVGDPLER